MARLLGNTWEEYDNFFFRPVNDTTSTLPPDVTQSIASIAGVTSGGAGEGLALTLFGNPVATTLKSAATGAESQSAPALGQSQSVPDVPSSHVSAGLHINLIPDASVANAPGTFSSEIRQAADLIEAAFSDPVTINLRYGWGTYNNRQDPALIGGNFAEGGDIGGQNVDYPTLKGWLTSDASSTEDNSAIAHFPGSVANSFHVTTAQLKALGHFTGDPNAVDGAIGWGTAWTSNFIDGALHELTHAMGRIFQDGLHYVMDLFRYDALGHFQWTGRQPAYLSIDGGATKLADFGVTSDFGDFRPGGVQGPDPFNEQVSGNNILTPVDITNMDVIGFNRANGSPRTPPDDFANSLNDTAHPFGALGVTGAVTGTLEVAGDRDWFRVSLVAGATYVINLQGQTAGSGTLEDPYLRVHNTAGAVLAENDDIQSGVNRDSQLVFQAQTTGVYYFEAGAFNDGYTGTYRLSVNSNSDDFRDSLTDTTAPFGSVAVNGSSTGTLETIGDRDWFGVQLNAGTTYDINLQGLQAGAGTLEDPYMRIHNSSGALVTENDDIVLGINRDSHLTFQATATGTYYIEAGAFDDNYTGTYRASISSVGSPGAGSVSINDVSITEGNSGSQIATFTVTRSGGTAAFDVNFITADNSATVADGDYLGNAGTVHFNDGVNTRPVSVTINGDIKVESNETFLVNLSGATNGASISDGQGIGTITNDDASIFPQPTFQLTAFAPGAGGWTSNDKFPRELADVNGDGKADIVGFGDAGAWVSLATGNGAFGDISLRTTGFAAGNGGWTSQDKFPRELADVNGDHMADIVGFGDAGVWVSLATGGGSFGNASLRTTGFAVGNGGWTSQDKFPRELADVNGDGMADIVGFGDAGVWVSLATGGGSFAAASLKPVGFGFGAGNWTSNDKFPRELADVNGDHMADIVGFGDAGVWVSLATGGGSFGPASLQVANFGRGAGGWTSENQFPRHLADVNHDGAADIIGFAQTGVIESLSNGFHLI